MNMNMLNNVTPIKVEPRDAFGNEEASFSSKADSSYFSLDDWSDEVVHSTPGRKSQPDLRCGESGVPSIESTPIRKTLFPGGGQSCDVPDNSSAREACFTFSHSCRHFFTKFLVI